MVTSVRLGEEDRAKLKRIAKDSGRSQSNVIRKLLELADTPEARRLLGIRESVNPNAAQNS